jgi:hypothetical protein
LALLPPVGIAIFFAFSANQLSSSPIPAAFRPTAPGHPFLKLREKTDRLIILLKAVPRGKAS